MISKKRILLIGGNYFPEPTGIGKYNGEMMDWLADNGHDCTVITTYPYYPQWKIQEPYTNKDKWYHKEEKTTKTANITVYRCPHFVPAKPSGLTRILSDFSFALSSLYKLVPFLFKKKYDVVIVVVPPFFLGILSVIYKKIKKSKIFYHIQDMQIEAAQDLGMIKSPTLLKFLYAAEQYIFRNTDVISSISPGMINKITQKAKKEVAFFPNWSDTHFFHPLADRKKLKLQYGFSENDIIVLYSGAIGEKQGLEVILDVAKRLEQQSVIFLISGSGPYKQKLIAKAEEKNVQNLRFLPLQPLEGFNEFLNMADVHLVLQKANASDLVMPSKLTNILAVGGVALVTAEKGTSLYEVVQQHNMGLLVKAEDTDALYEGILRAVREDMSVISKNARSYADEYLSIDKVMARFEVLL